MLLTPLFKVAHFVHPAAQGIFGAPIRLMTSGMSPFLSSVWLVVVRVIACATPQREMSSLLSQELDLVMEEVAELAVARVGGQR